MRLYQELGNKLRDAIVEGVYLPGEKLPPERDIANKFSVSRSVVREALILLELQQFVDIRKGSGVYVLPLLAEKTITPAPESPSFGRFELLQARQLLEGEIAAFAALQATKSDILALRKLIDLERDQLTSGMIDDSLDEHFHYLIACASQNSAMVAIVEQSWKLRSHAAMWQGNNHDTSDFNARWGWFEDRQKILQAITLRDPKAARMAMWQHLENVKNKMLAQADHDQPDFDGNFFASVPPESLR
ncbi:GntR family transcriptional regulator [Buttiauxella sp.]|uniref:GntR family transcriptional regulator n=1 Tax=Buttiauxella sp. TaxID=1972222 RepID=UPI003C72C606